MQVAASRKKDCESKLLNKHSQTVILAIILRRKYRFGRLQQAMEISGQREFQKSSRRARKIERKTKASKSVSPYPRVLWRKPLLWRKALKEKNGGNPWSSEQVASVLGISPRGWLIICFSHRKKVGLTDGNPQFPTAKCPYRARPGTRTVGVLKKNLRRSGGRF